MTGNSSSKGPGQWFGRSWPTLIYGGAVILGAVGLVAKSTAMLTFSGELLLVPGLIQAQQGRNRRRRRQEEKEERDAQAKLDSKGEE